MFSSCSCACAYLAAFGGVLRRWRAARLARHAASDVSLQSKPMCTKSGQPCCRHFFCRLQGSLVPWRWCLEMPRWRGPGRGTHGPRVPFAGIGGSYRRGMRKPATPEEQNRNACHSDRNACKRCGLGCCDLRSAVPVAPGFRAHWTRNRTAAAPIHISIRLSAQVQRFCAYSVAMTACMVHLLSIAMLMWTCT